MEYNVERIFKDEPAVLRDTARCDIEIVENMPAYEVLGFVGVVLRGEDNNYVMGIPFYEDDVAICAIISVGKHHVEPLNKLFNEED